MENKIKSCIFCKIINKAIPADIIFENDDVIAFNDINPQAPNHILIIPKFHIESINELNKNNAEFLSQMVLTATKIAKDKGINDSGYRLIINNGPDAGQAVSHLHLHLLGGRKMSWPPG